MKTRLIFLLIIVLSNINVFSQPKKALFLGNSSTVAPVGLTWKYAMDNDPDSMINLYKVDNSHPSPAGTYLTACVMYATMI